MLSWNILELGQAFRAGQRIVEYVPEPNILKVQTSSMEPGIDPEPVPWHRGLNWYHGTSLNDLTYKGLQDVSFLLVQIELRKHMHGGFYRSFQQARDATCLTVPGEHADH